MLTIKNLCAQKVKFQLKSMNFSVNDGEIVGLIGRNGSGKTTLMQCLSGQYPLSSGSFFINGKRLWEMTPDELEKIVLLDTSNQAFKVNAKAKRLTKFLKFEYPRFDEERFSELIERMGLDENKTPSAYSLGQYELYLFAVAIAQGAKLILIDETLSALDVIGKETLFEILREYTEEGGSLLITSHNLSDLDRLCDRLVFIENGEIILESSPDELKEEYAVIEIAESELENIPREAILYSEIGELSRSLLVKKAQINPTYLNRSANLEDIVTKYLKCEKEKRS